VEGGEEAAVRAVMLDSMDGGAQENILFDEGSIIYTMYYLYLLYAIRI
jgi:hypothetical protein